MPFRSVAEQHLSDLIDLFQSILTGNTELAVRVDFCVLKEQKSGLSYKSLLRCLLSFPGHKDDRTVVILSEHDGCEHPFRFLPESFIDPVNFGIPFFPPSVPVPGTVRLEFGTLPIYSRPTTESPVLASAYHGAEVTVYGEYEGWYLVRFGEAVGYAAADFIQLV